jgi:hypothetical protein
MDISCKQTTTIIFKQLNDWAYFSLLIYDLNLLLIKYHVKKMYIYITLVIKDKKT